MERTKEIEARLGAIAAKRNKLAQEQRELEVERAQIAFDAQGYHAGQRMRFLRGRTQARVVEIVKPVPRWNRFDIVARTVKKGTGELGEEFRISAYDFGNLSPLEEQATS